MSKPFISLVAIATVAGCGPSPSPTFSGPLPGIPKATKQFVASFPGLPL